MGSKSLNNFLRESANRTFRWGEWDCLTFTNSAWHVMHGRGWADDWIGRYNMRKAMRREELIAEYGFASLPDAIDTKLTPCPLQPPPTGALVITPRATHRGGTGYAMGIAIGSRGAFLGASGVIYLPITDAVRAWT